MVITCEIDIAVGCVLSQFMHQCEVYVPTHNEASVIYLYKVWPCLFCDVCQNYEI